MTHPNSSESLKRVDKETRHRQILDTLEREAGPMTDRMIKNYLGLKDMNDVRPRINELLESGKIRESASETCRETGRTVRTVIQADGRLF
jgi:hypothetical protein